MLNANTTRDLNQAARAAKKYLSEEGLTLSHNQGLNLVARMVGYSHHMAAQAALPTTGIDRPVAIKSFGDLQKALNALTEEQLRMSVTVSEGCDENGDAEFFDCVQFMLAGDDSLLAASDGVIEANQPVLLFGGANVNQEFVPESAEQQALASLTRETVIDDLCRVLAHPDLDSALHREGISDAAYNALARATTYVNEDVLKLFNAEALSRGYDNLPTSSEPEEFLAGHGGWGLHEGEFRTATAIAKALVALKLSQEPHSSAEAIERVAAQFEMSLGQPPAIAREAIAKHGLERGILHLNNTYELSISVGPRLVMSDANEGFWCNGFGWTSYSMAATGYPKDFQLDCNFARLQRDARLVNFSEVKDLARE